MDFRIGAGLAGIHDGGNEGEDVRFFGGKYGIITRTPSPGWQFTLVDTTFEGQRVAAIQSELRPHADPAALPERAHRDHHESGHGRAAVDQGRAHGGRELAPRS